MEVNTYTYTNKALYFCCSVSIGECWLNCPNCMIYRKVKEIQG